MLPLIFLLFSFNPTFGCKTGISSCISSALDRIQRSDRYDLIPGLFFVRSRNETQNETRNLSIFNKAEKVFKTHELYWNALPGVDFKVANGEKGFSLKVDPHRHDLDLQDSSRTFGFRRRLKMVMLPLMFKLGVITTLLGMLTLFSLKGLTISILLLALALGSLFSKLKFNHHHSSGGWESHGWEPHKEVHLHVHPYMTGHGHWQRMDQYMDPSYFTQPPPNYYYSGSRKSREMPTS